MLKATRVIYNKYQHKLISKYFNINLFFLLLKFCEVFLWHPIWWREHKTKLYFKEIIIELRRLAHFWLKSLPQLEQSNLWKEVVRSDALNSFIFVFRTYNLNEILWRNMNCHTESVSTGHSAYCCPVNRVCSWKKTQIEKKNIASANILLSGNIQYMR